MPDDDLTPPPIDPNPAPVDPAPVDPPAPDTTESPAPAPEPAPAPTEAKPDGRQTPWYMKRIAEESNAKREALQREATKDAEIDALKRAFAALSPGHSAAAPTSQPTPVPILPATTEQDFNNRVAAEAVRISAVKAFNERCDQSFEAGQAAHPDFKDAVDTLNAAGAMSAELVEAALETGVGHEVLYCLGKDPDAAVKLSKLSPVKLAIEVAKLAGEVQKPPAPKPVSSAPAPITPVHGTARGGFDVADTSTPVDAWIAKREKEVQTRREQRGR